MSDYIEVCRWEEFQHYTKRDPIWIKNYTRLLDDDRYRGLSFAQRGLLHGIWLSYAKTAQRLPRDTLELSRYLGEKVRNDTVESLIDAGFIRVVASSTLARRYHVASPETETELEESNPLLEQPQTDAPKSRKNGWVDNLNSYTGCKLVRGEFAMSAKYDVLGKDRPPSDWPHERPSRKEILKALTEQAEGSAVA